MTKTKVVSCVAASSALRVMNAVLAGPHAVR